MKIGKIYITDKLTSLAYENALKQGVNTIVCRNSIVDNRKQGIQIISGGGYRIPAGWWLRDILINCIDLLPQSWNSHHGLTLKSTLIKLNLWSFHKDAQVAFGAMKAHVDIDVNKILFKPNKWTSWLIVCLKWFLFKMKPLQEIAVDVPKNRLIFYATSDNDIEIWRNLIVTFKPSEILIVLSDKGLMNNKFIQEIQLTGYEIVQVGLIPRNKYNPFPHFNSKTLVIQRNIYNHIHELNKFISIGNWMLSVQPKGVLFNAGENKPEAHLISEKLLNAQIKTYNTMNGIKAKTANNADVKFTKWFVWDEKMKNVLSQCFIDQSMLHVSGHLMQDFALKYSYKGLLKQEKSYYDRQPVVAFFSINDEIPEKKDVFTLLSRMQQFNQLIIKEHPTYKGDDSIYYNRFSDNIEVLKGNGSKDVLYDILTVADLVIVLGSTIALEATWFNIPVVTVEYKQTSNLYCADGEKIKHLNTKQQLEHYMGTIVLTKKNKMVQTDSNVALKYKQVIKDSL